jgi:hypothetical protein
MLKTGDCMKDKPDMEKVKQIAPEAINLEEIGSGGFKVVYPFTAQKCDYTDGRAQVLGT